MQGLRIEGRNYSQAIGIIGGSTGLEALNAAQEFPNAEVIVIDPLARFARNILTQLARIEAGEQDPEIKWDFFLKGPRLTYGQTSLDDLKWLLDNPPGEKAMEDLFLPFVQNIKSTASRINLVEASTSQVAPSAGSFDEIRMYYPHPGSFKDRSIYEFIAEGLKLGGKFKLITEKEEIACHFYNFGGDQITSYGKTERHGVIKHPVSVYDLVLGTHGYQFVNIRKQRRLIPPSALKLFALDAFLNFAILQMTLNRNFQKTWE